MNDIPIVIADVIGPGSLIVVGGVALLVVGGFVLSLGALLGAIVKRSKNRRHVDREDESQ